MLDKVFGYECTYCSVCFELNPLGLLYLFEIAFRFEKKFYCHLTSEFMSKINLRLHNCSQTSLTCKRMNTACKLLEPLLVFMFVLLLSVLIRIISRD